MNRAQPCAVIVDEDPLSQAYIPDRLPARDAQVGEVLTCLSPLLKGHPPIHVWLHGPPGSGKTATVLHVLGQLHGKAPVVTAVLNCWATATFFEVVDDLVTQLRILRAEEHRTSVKIEKLRRHLGTRPAVIVLDEIDRMRASERSAVLYNLFSLGNVALLCISSTLDGLFELDERARSRLNPHPVAFATYSARELKRILAFRAESGLAPRTWRDGDLLRIAEIAEGDARIAIGSLRAAAELAEESRCARISLSAVEKRWMTVVSAKREQILNTLTLDHRILYEIVEQRRQILLTDLWNEYLRRCGRLERKPLASRTFSNYTNRLVEVGLLASERARVKGKVRLFRMTEGSHG